MPVAKRKMTRADVEEEIRRAQDHGSSGNPIPPGGAYPVDDDYPNLDDADLSGVDLSGLDLGLASLRRADLKKATLTDANLSGAALNEADLTGTTRTRGADLTRTLMYFARLGGADLGRAVLRPAYPNFLENATYDDHTLWPEGFDPKEYGARRAAPAWPISE